MRVDTDVTTDLSRAAASASASEAAGYDAVWAAETNHDPFFPLLIAAGATERIQLGTSIAVAFSRSPMTLAVTANDLHLASKGRHILGLGSQIKPHIEKRFSMPWSHPAPRMREFILAMRAIWDCWNNGSKLEFRGQFYKHTLMTPMFSPEPNPYGSPAVYLAGVGELMTETAGEVCDGFISHGFTTERYMREVTLPALERGRAKAGKTMDGFDFLYPAFIVTGSTPAYKAVLDMHGWGDVHGSLNTLSKQGRWVEMGDLITDEMLDTFAIVAEPGDLANQLKLRYADIANRVMVDLPKSTDPELWAEVLAELKKSGGGPSR
jgi:alkanesulfonate monooxygenase SsuD/methylene tetrahydromethanopterin reductase-like flavin-dependent oxidoreductase (luciferase family)